MTLEATSEGKRKMEPNCRSVSPKCQVPNLQFLRANSGQIGRVRLDAYSQTNRHAISVAVIERSNGRTHFELDLWRTNWVFRPEAYLRLRQLGEANLTRSQGRVESRPFQGNSGKNYLRFDVPTEHSAAWEALLVAIFSTDGLLDRIS
jgi:hypothetical protein